MSARHKTGKEWQTLFPLRPWQWYFLVWRYFLLKTLPKDTREEFLKDYFFRNRHCAELQNYIKVNPLSVPVFPHRGWQRKFATLYMSTAFVSSPFALYCKCNPYTIRYTAIQWWGCIYVYALYLMSYIVMEWDEWSVGIYVVVDILKR